MKPIFKVRKAIDPCPLALEGTFRNTSSPVKTMFVFYANTAEQNLQCFLISFQNLNL